MERRNPLITLSGSTDRYPKKVPLPGSQLIKEGCRAKGCASHWGEQSTHFDPEPQLWPSPFPQRLHPHSSVTWSLGLWESGSLLAAVPTRLTGGGGVLSKAYGLFPEAPRNSPTRM